MNILDLQQSGMMKIIRTVQALFQILAKNVAKFHLETSKISLKSHKKQANPTNPFNFINYYENDYPSSFLNFGLKCH